MRWYCLLMLGWGIAAGERLVIAAEFPERIERQMAGWTVHIDPALLQQQAELTAQALTLLEDQLREISRLLSGPIVQDLQQVSLWISPEYPQTAPRAEYHPGAEWLIKNGRDPRMVKGVEFTNVRIFEQEVRRMPNFVLHELAHAYHDRVLRDDSRIEAAYAAAVADGLYQRVERRDANGQVRTDRHYGLSNAKEYFAEGTEAYLGTNDFFPFRREELRDYDPRLFALLEQIWKLRSPAMSESTPESPGVPH